MATDHYLIATYSDELKGYYEPLRDQVAASGVDFLYQPAEPGTFSWRKLIDWELAVAKSYPDALIAFCDAWDMLYFGSRKEFAEVVGAQPLLFHTDRQCWPHPEKATKYHQRVPTVQYVSPWFYVNGTGPAGTGSAIAEAIEYGLANFPITDDSKDVHDLSKDNDQRFFTDVYLAGFGVLDTRCALSQSLVSIAPGELAVRDGRLYNKITGTYPLFVHANGASAMIGQRGLMDMLKAYRPARPW